MFNANKFFYRYLKNFFYIINLKQILQNSIGKTVFRNFDGLSQKLRERSYYLQFDNNVTRL